MSDQPHVYVHSKADYTNTCQKCGRGKGNLLHQQEPPRGITIGDNNLDTSDPWEALTILSARCDALRALVTEILDVFDPSRGGVLPGHFGRAQIVEWRERAGLEEIREGLR